jgi:hypothetical protein
MDEDQYRQTYQTVSSLACPFERALLTRRCACTKAEHVLLAEREVVVCQLSTAQRACTTLHDLLKEKARFALQLTQLDAELPHGKEMKVVCGGLAGLQTVLHPARVGMPVADISALVTEVRERYGDLTTLPWEEVVRAVTAYQPRRRGHVRK